MKVKIHEFKMIVPKPADGGGAESGEFMLSKDLLTIPEIMLNQQAVVETFLEGVKGINECCSRIYVDGYSWLVLGDVRSVCYTNDTLVIRY